MHATADIDRINLNVAVVREGVRDVGDWFVKQQRSAHEATGGLSGNSQKGAQAVGLSRDVRKKQAFGIRRGERTSFRRLSVEVAVRDDRRYPKELAAGNERCSASAEPTFDSIRKKAVSHGATRLSDQG